MEKFTRWEDKSNGINPFVPNGRQSRALPLAAAGAVLAVVKLVLLFGVGLVLAVGLGLETVVVARPLRALVRLIITRPLVRLMLLLLGFWTIGEALPDPRRLRLGKLSKKGVSDSQEALQSFGRTVRRGDLLLFNSTSIVEVLYLYARFSADFVVPSLPDGNGFKQVGLVGALKRAAYHGIDPSKAPCNGGTARITELQSSANFPLAVFAEGARTNGKAVMEFVPALAQDTAFHDGTTRVHITAFSYPHVAWSPCNPVDGILTYLFRACSMFRNTMYVNLVPYEVWTAERENRANNHPETDVRSLLASAVGNRGVKQVALSLSVYFDFLEYYHSSSLYVAVGGRHISSSAVPSKQAEPNERSGLAG
ncbi:Lysophospholipid acyltransferase LPEAT2 [Hondaea fermentalgiana]|uniref:Lysophospholipid acyltransferase LPEAT2 n=1 Tax=Hondaea fermentalgiana TaxID=2315210 RepID=A0A2R5GF43_9STRA|nr:Lysophospholipid acyltransferase LPEAT2 [Hondaea fermentalgiana]|eukprot:GBG29540.1 Lysophospholipid acyltransferase LPEAT2 [Hondaea fermentalgiana]